MRFINMDLFSKTMNVRGHFDQSKLCTTDKFGNECKHETMYWQK